MKANIFNIEIRKSHYWFDEYNQGPHIVACVSRATGTNEKDKITGHMARFYHCTKSSINRIFKVISA